MIQDSNIAKYYHYLIGFCAFIVGAYSKWILVGLIPLMLCALIGWRKGEFQFHSRWIQWSWTIIYFFYVIMTILNWDDDLGPQQIEYKLSWFIFPLLFSFYPRFKFEKKGLVIGLTLGVLLASILGITKAIQACITIGVTLTSYTSSNICINHPTYFSATATIALILIIENWNQPFITQFPKYIKFITIGFITTMILLSFSMAGFLYIATLGALSAIYIFLKKETPKRTKLLLLVLPLIFIGAIAKNEFIIGEFNNTRAAVIDYVANPALFISKKQQSQNGDEVRLIMWTATFLEIMDHPWGVAPTKTGEHLGERLEQLNQPEMAKRNGKGEVHYNPHNQYLQMALEIGWIPAILFLFVLGYLFFIGINSNKLSLSAITLLLGFHCLFESILQRQSGIVTFTFFITVMVMSIFLQQDKTEEDVA